MHDQSHRRLGPGAVLPHARCASDDWAAPRPRAQAACACVDFLASSVSSPNAAAGIGRVPHATGLLQDVFHYISSQYPFWDRKGGRDHIFVRGTMTGGQWAACPLRSWLAQRTAPIDGSPGNATRVSPPARSLFRTTKPPAGSPTRSARPSSCRTGAAPIPATRAGRATVRGRAVCGPGAFLSAALPQGEGPSCGCVQMFRTHARRSTRSSASPHATATAGGDNYTFEHRHDSFLPRGHLERLTKGPCFDKKKGRRSDCALVGGSDHLGAPASHGLSPLARLFYARCAHAAHSLPPPSPQIWSSPPCTGPSFTSFRRWQAGPPSPATGWPCSRAACWCAACRGRGAFLRGGMRAGAC